MALRMKEKLHIPEILTSPTSPVSKVVYVTREGVGYSQEQVGLVLMVRLHGLHPAAAVLNTHSRFSDSGS